MMPGVDLTRYKHNTQALIKINPLWQKLINEGKFDENAALSTMKNFPKVFDTLEIRDFDDVFNTNFSSLRRIKKYQGGEMVTLLIIKMITDLTASFNISPKLSPMQIRTVSQMILRQYHRFNIADFRLCFDNVLMGKYGKIYNRLDVSVILQWLKDYDEEQTEANTSQQVNKYKLNCALSSKDNCINTDKFHLLLEKLNANKKEKEGSPQKLKIKGVHDFIIYRNFSNTFAQRLEEYLKVNWQKECLQISFESYSERWIALLIDWLNKGKNMDLSAGEIFKKMEKLKISEYE